MFGIVYKITNLITKKTYVGQTVRDLHVRWNEHCVDKRSGSILQSAVKKYGKENFVIEVMCRCDSLEEMNHREAYYINLFNSLSPNGYNLKSGGYNSIPTEASRLKMSVARKGILLSQDTRAKMSERQLGEKNHMFGKNQTKKSNLKRSRSLLGRKQLSPHIEARIKNRRIAVICVETNIIYNSLALAAKAFQTSTSYLSRALRNGYKVRNHTLNILEN